MKKFQYKMQNIISIVLFVFCATLFSSCGSSDAKNASSTDSTSSTKGEVYKFGFIPLTDCASLVMAKELGLFEKIWSECGSFERSFMG